MQAFGFVTGIVAYMRMFGALDLFVWVQVIGGNGAGVGNGVGGGVGAGDEPKPLVQFPALWPTVPFFRLHTPVPWFIVQKVHVEVCWQAVQH